MGRCDMNSSGCNNRHYVAHGAAWQSIKHLDEASCSLEARSPCSNGAQQGGLAALYRMQHAQRRSVG